MIHLEAKGKDEVIITNLVLTITGGATTNLGTIQVTQGQNIYGLISDIAGAYTSGFTLTGNIVYPAGFEGSQEEKPGIEFFALYDRSQAAQADLTLSKSHTGDFVQGQIGATYTLTATQYRPGGHHRPVTGRGQLPSGADSDGGRRDRAGPARFQANTCSCTRSDPLNAGASYPPITLTVNVASTAPPEVINGAAITGGSDGNSANNVVTDPTVIIRGPDLTITKTATGSFTQGQIGAGYTLAVGNAGGLGTSGGVTVTDSLPTGLAPASVSGPGWACGISGNTMTCTRSDPLPPGGSYPPINLTVNVASNAPPSVTNQATVGGGGDLNASNNTASATTPIARDVRLDDHQEPHRQFHAGTGNASYTVTVTNVGAAPTNASVVVSDPMGLPLIPRSASGSGWTCETLSTLIRCQRSDALAPGASYPPITMTASIAADAPPTVTNVVSVSGGGDGNASNNSAIDVATVVPAADLSITKSHAGNFIQGQPGTYTLTITNTGVAATSGSVTVVDQLPGGLAPTTASGTGWTCEHRRPGGELHPERRAGVGAKLPGDHADRERAAQRPCVGDEQRVRVRRRRGQYVEQHRDRSHDHHPWRKPDHHQEPHGQLHARPDRKLYPDREQRRRRADAQPRHRDRQPPCGTGGQCGSRHGLVVHGRRPESHV